jgi:hypothetical protein
VPTSRATAPNSSLDGTSWATSVATRRSAACSSANRASPARLSAFATAVASSSVNWTRRASVSDVKGSDCSEPAAITPQTRPSTMIGVPTAERTPPSRTATSIAPEASTEVSIRAGRQVRTTSEQRLLPSSFHRLPTGKTAAELPHAATKVTSPLGSQRLMSAQSTPSSRPTSCVIAAKTSSGAAPHATTVATRRNAACSATSALRSAWLTRLGSVTPSRLRAYSISPTRRGIATSSCDATGVTPRSGKILTSAKYRAPPTTAALVKLRSIPLT